MINKGELITITKEELQRRIDKSMEIANRKEEKERIRILHIGKASAYTELYNELYPEMEGKRAYLLKEK